MVCNSLSRCWVELEKKIESKQPHGTRREKMRQMNDVVMWPCSCSLSCMFLLIAKWASVNESGVGFVFSEACILRANHAKTPAIQMHMSEWVYAFDWTWCRAHTHLLLHWHQAGKILVFELNKWTFVKWIYIRNMLTIVASSAFLLCRCASVVCFLSFFGFECECEWLGLIADCFSR